MVANPRRSRPAPAARPTATAPHRTAAPGTGAPSRSLLSAPNGSHELRNAASPRLQARSHPQGGRAAERFAYASVRRKHSRGGTHEEGFEIVRTGGTTREIGTMSFVALGVRAPSLC